MKQYFLLRVGALAALLFALLGSVLLLVVMLFLYFTPDPHSFDMTKLGGLVADAAPVDGLEAAYQQAAAALQELTRG